MKSAMRSERREKRKHRANSDSKCNANKRKPSTGANNPCGIEANREKRRIDSDKTMKSQQSSSRGAFGVFSLIFSASFIPLSVQIKCTSGRIDAFTLSNGYVLFLFI